MTKRLVLKFLGAISSAMIIVGVFLPYVKVEGFSHSLWQYYNQSDTMYLPILLVVFGVLALLFFLIDKKTEFAYMSTGAVLFFMIMETVDILEQGTFNTLSIGYYFLSAGAIFVGFIAFLLNLKSKNKIVMEDNNVEVPTPISVQQMPIQSNNAVNELKPIDLQSIQSTSTINNNPIPDVVVPIVPLENDKVVPESISSVGPDLSFMDDINSTQINEPISVLPSLSNDSIKSEIDYKSQTNSQELFNNVTPVQQKNISETNDFINQQGVLNNAISSQQNNTLVQPQTNSQESFNDITPVQQKNISETNDFINQQGVLNNVVQQNNISEPNNSNLDIFS